MAEQTRYWYKCQGYQGLKGIIPPHPYESDRRLDEDARKQCSACVSLSLEDLANNDKPLEEL